HGRDALLVHELDVGKRVAFHVPQRRGAVIAPDQNGLSVGANGDRVDSGRMLKWLAKGLARLCVPQAGCLVVAPREYGVSIAAESQRRNCISMGERLSDRFAGLEFGKPGLLIVAAGEHGFSIGTDGHGPNRVWKLDHGVESMNGA